MKRSCSISIFIAAAVLALLSMSVAGCGPKRVASIWFAPASVENDQPDWMTLAAYRLDKLDGSMTIANDSSVLYVRFMSRDPRLLRRLERNGLMIWLSPSGSKTERVGIHYPLGNQKQAATFHADRFLPDAQLSPDAMTDLLTQENDDFDILIGDSAIHASNSGGESEQRGIGVFLKQTPSGSLEYTLQIRRGNLAPWITPGARITMDVESAASTDRQEEGRDFDRGFDDRLPERPSGGMRGDRRGEGDDEAASGVPLNKPIHFRFEILLAESSKAK